MILVGPVGASGIRGEWPMGDATSPADATSRPLTTGELARQVWHDFRRAFTPLVLFELAFKGLAALLLLPGLAWALSALMEATGRSVVTNADLVGFFLSPAGLFYAALFGIASLGLWLLEHAGVMSVVVLTHFGIKAGIKRTVAVVASAFTRIVRLGLAILAASVVGLAPFVGLMLLACSTLLSEYDINHYLKDRPRELYLVVAIGVVLALAAAALAAYLYVRWVFSLALVIFEERQPIPAMHESARRVRGAGWHIGGVLLGWHLIGLALSAGCLFLFRALSSYLLDGIGNRPSVVIPTVALLFTIKVVLIGVISFLAVTIHCLLILRLYAERSTQLGVIERGTWVPHVVSEAPPTPWLVRHWWAGGVGLAAGILIVCVVISSQFQAPTRVEVTGHRGHTTRAPENTLAAIRAAIEDGADYAEIDVQESKDGEIVLLHDNDLKRVCGVGAMVCELTMDELRKLDAGRHFSAEFTGERLPTLREVIHEARGKIKLNVELKFPDEEKAERKATGKRKKETRAQKKARLSVQKERLAKKVADLIREEGFEKECIVMSLDAEGVLLAKKHNAKLRTGLIISANIGNLEKLPVDVWSVNSRLVDDDLMRRARRRGKEVHVWWFEKGAQRESEFRRLIQRGVANIITDYPDKAVKVRDEMQGLSDVDHMLLSYRSLLEP
jgi:glycerophosphoryl diester phosphodiesterase